MFRPPLKQRQNAQQGNRPYQRDTIGGSNAHSHALKSAATAPIARRGLVFQTQPTGPGDPPRSILKKNQAPPGVGSGISGALPNMRDEDDEDDEDDDDGSFNLSQYIDDKVELEVQTQPMVRRAVPQVPQTPQADLSVTLQGSQGPTKGHLRPVTCLPPALAAIFSPMFPYFNVVQSAVLDTAFFSDRNLVLAAPTGAGKTVVFELALLREMQKPCDNSRSISVYLAPMRSLCGERFRDWSSRLKPIGVRCIELTGDTHTSEGVDELSELKNVDLVLTTPEKWDSVTRRWRRHADLVRRIRLIMIDEVHLLNDGHRGHTLEAVVSRMKTIMKGKEDDKMKLRFVAVSATIPNAQDVAEWLEGAECRLFGEEVRPVQLRRVVVGYPCRETQGDFKFEMNLSYRVAELIATYSEGKPTLIFANSRRSAQSTAQIIAKDRRAAAFDFRHKQRLSSAAAAVGDTQLTDLLLRGVGFHHAGLESSDRLVVEELFLEGALPVLVSTSTLSMGVNLPAHLVIIKSTNQMANGGYVEYGEAQILQMMGRAGRPQFDTTATAIIMTKQQYKRRYEELASGRQMIESSLHDHLHEHINAEIVLATITDISKAMEWVKSTYFFVRVFKNPRYYKLPLGLERKALEQRVQDMIMVCLNQLNKISIIEMGDYDLRPLEGARIMAKNYMQYATMATFHKISPDESLPGVLMAVCKSKELAEMVQLRRLEKTVLNTLNKDKHKKTIRYPIEGKVSTSHGKASILLQASLDCLNIPDATLSRESLVIARTAARLARCLVEYLWDRSETSFKALSNAILLSKSLHAGIWHNSDYVSKQFERVGPIYSACLVNAGFTSFDKIASADERELEMVMNKQQPFGNHVKNAAKYMPRYDLAVEQVDEEFGWDKAKLRVRVLLTNREALLDRSSAHGSHAVVLLVGNHNNETLIRVRVRDSLLKDRDFETFVNVQSSGSRREQSVHLTVSLLSERLAGVDVDTTFQPRFGRRKRASEYFEVDEEDDGWMVENDLLTDTIMEDMNNEWVPDKTPAKKLRQMIIKQTANGKLSPEITEKGDAPNKTPRRPKTPSQQGSASPSAPGTPGTPGTQTKVTNFFNCAKKTPLPAENKSKPRLMPPPRSAVGQQAQRGSSPSMPQPLSKNRPLLAPPKASPVQISFKKPIAPPAPASKPSAAAMPSSEPPSKADTSIFDMEETLCLDEILPHMEACEGRINEAKKQQGKPVMLTSKSADPPNATKIVNTNPNKTGTEGLRKPLSTTQKEDTVQINHTSQAPTPAKRSSAFQPQREPVKNPIPSSQTQRSNPVPQSQPSQSFAQQTPQKPPGPFTSTPKAFPESSRSLIMPKFPPLQSPAAATPSKCANGSILKSFMDSHRRNGLNTSSIHTPFYPSSQSSNATPKRPRLLENYMGSVTATADKRSSVTTAPSTPQSSQQQLYQRHAQVDSPRSVHSVGQMNQFISTHYGHLNQSRGEEPSFLHDARMTVDVDKENAQPQWSVKEIFEPRNGQSATASPRQQYSDMSPQLQYSQKSPQQQYSEMSPQLQSFQAPYLAQSFSPLQYSQQPYSPQQMSPQYNPQPSPPYVQQPGSAQSASRDRPLTSLALHNFLRSHERPQYRAPEQGGNMDSSLLAFILSK